VDTVFAMTTPFEQGIDAETAQGLALLDAALRAGTGHLVFSSVSDANRATGIPHFESKYAVEQAITASGVPYTILAPVFFMENFFQPWLAGGLQEGKLAMAMPGTRPLQQIALSDVGAFAAALIKRREAVFGRRFDIAGDELTGRASAAVLSEVLGREIRYEGFPPEALRAYSEDTAVMFEWFDATGYSAPIADLRRDFPEVEWLTLARWGALQTWPAAASAPA
jgi:uncharacterized protein YbjT (DUF2867 family)